MTDYALNIRNSSGFVTDSAPATYFLAELYPTTRGGLTFGYVNVNGDPFAVLVPLDRSNSVDARFAGMHYYGGGPRIIRFQVDLPSTGSWTVRLASGDPNGGGAGSARRLRVYDNTTSVIDLSYNLGSASQYYDATGTLRTSEADWIANNAGVTYAFTTTSVFVELGDGSTEGQINHIFFSPAGGGAASVPYTPNRQFGPVADQWMWS